MLKNIPYGQDLEWDWTVLDYNGWPVRIFIINNIPWWALTDVCNLIGLDNASKTALRLDDNEKMPLTLGNSRSGRRGGAQKLLIINEPGPYHLLFTSEKPEAKFFRRWSRLKYSPPSTETVGTSWGKTSWTQMNWTMLRSKSPKTSLRNGIARLPNCLSKIGRRPCGSVSWNRELNTENPFFAVQNL